MSDIKSFKSKAIFTKFMIGDYGLAITFWFSVVILGVTLNYLNGHIDVQWQWFVLGLFTLTSLVLTTIAIWNASKKYKGSKLWVWVARLITMLVVLRWIIAIPDLILAFLSMVGVQVHSNDYWKLNSHNLTCEPALYQFTPDRMAKKYKECIAQPIQEGKAIYLDCRASEIKTEYIYSRSLVDCERLLKKVNDSKTRD